MRNAKNSSRFVMMVLFLAVVVAGFCSTACCFGYDADDAGGVIEHKAAVQGYDYTNLLFIVVFIVIFLPLMNSWISRK